MAPKFQFFEVVKVKVLPQIPPEIHGKRGHIAGMSESEDGSAVGYAVFIYDLEVVWDIEENFLESTGEMTTYEDWYDGTHIKVIVNPETGEGDLTE